MTAIGNALVGLGAGKSGQERLLDAVWTEGWGIRVFGRTESAGLLARYACDSNAPALIYETPRAAVATDGETALFADLVDGGIVRLWRVGAGSAPSRPRLAVPFDPDMSQIGGAPAFAASDHLELEPDRADRLLAALSEIVEVGHPMLTDTLSRVGRGAVVRRRIAVMRAFETGTTTLALLRVHLFPLGEIAPPVAVNAVARIDPASLNLICDDLPVMDEASWTPSLHRAASAGDST